MRSPTAAVVLFAFSTLVIASCAGVRVALPPNAIPGPELRHGGGELHVYWRQTAHSPEKITVGIFLKSTPTHILLLTKYQDRNYAYTEIPLEKVNSVELVMQSPSRYTLPILLSSGNLVPFCVALSHVTSGEPYEIKKVGLLHMYDYGAILDASELFLGGVAVGLIISSIHGFYQLNKQRVLADRIIKASQALQESQPTTSPPPLRQ